MAAAKHWAGALTPGRVLRLSCTHITPPKDKYCVLIAVERYSMYLFINSNPTDLQRNRPDLMAGLVEIGRDDRIGRDDCPGVLHRMSYLDCNEPEFDPDIDEIVRQLDEDPKRILGIVPQPIVDAVRTALAQSLMITPGDLRTALAEFN